MGASRPPASGLPASINTNPVVVRRITGQLARAGLVRVRRGTGWGRTWCAPPEQITLEDVWHAVNPGPPKPLLPLARQPGPGLSRSDVASTQVLGDAFSTAERALERALARTTLADLLHGRQPPPRPRTSCLSRRHGSGPRSAIAMSPAEWCGCFPDQEPGTHHADPPPSACSRPPLLSARWTLPLAALARSRCRRSRSAF